MWDSEYLCSLVGLCWHKACLYIFLAGLTCHTIMKLTLCGSDGSLNISFHVTGDSEGPNWGLSRFTRDRFYADMMCMHKFHQLVYVSRIFLLIDDMQFLWVTKCFLL